MTDRLKHQYKHHREHDHLREYGILGEATTGVDERDDADEKRARRPERRHLVSQIDHLEKYHLIDVDDKDYENVDDPVDHPERRHLGEQPDHITSMHLLDDEGVREKEKLSRAMSPADKLVPNEGKAHGRKRLPTGGSEDHIAAEALLKRGTAKSPPPPSTFGSGRDRPPPASIEDGGSRVRVLSLKKRPPMPAATAAYLAAMSGGVSRALQFDGAGVSSNSAVRRSGKRHLHGRSESNAILPR